MIAGHRSMVPPTPPQWDPPQPMGGKGGRDHGLTYTVWGYMSKVLFVIFKCIPGSLNRLSPFFGSSTPLGQYHREFFAEPSFDKTNNSRELNFRLLGGD